MGKKTHTRKSECEKRGGGERNEGGEGGRERERATRNLANVQTSQKRWACRFKPILFWALLASAFVPVPHCCPLVDPGVLSAPSLLAQESLNSSFLPHAAFLQDSQGPGHPSSAGWHEGTPFNSGPLSCMNSQEESFLA